jgi:phospholipase/carboxylesterase
MKEAKSYELAFSSCFWYLVSKCFLYEVSRNFWNKILLISSSRVIKSRAYCFLTIILCCTISLSYSQSLKTDLIYKTNEPLKKIAKQPVLIMLHGYGSNEEDLFDISKSIDECFMTYSLRAPNATNGGGFCWYTITKLTGQQFEYDYTQAKLSKAKILSFISEVCKINKLDSTQVFLMGFSQGAIMAYDIALSFPKKIKGVLALSGRMMEETKKLVKDTTSLSKVKFFIAHGTNDNVISVIESEKVNIFLKLKKVKDVSFVTYDIPHSINGKELNDIKKWLVKAITVEEKKQDQINKKH